MVEAYERDGIFERWNFQWLWTHCEGGAIRKIMVGLKAYLSMLGLLIKGSVSFMHLHSAMRGSFWRKSLFMKTAQLFGVPCIFHLHGSEMKTFYNGLPTLGKLLVKWSLEHAETVVVLSDSWEVFISNVAPKAKIVVINNYVRVPSEIVKGADVVKFDVLFLGILGQRKGIYDLLEVWPEVVKAVPYARLLIGGNGEVEKAKETVEKLKIQDSVEFLGWVDGESKLDYLKHMDAFALPSYNEGLPMSVLEAMSYQKPVVTTNVGGIPELLKNGVNGIMIEAGNQKALTEALVKLGVDSQMRESIAAAGRERVAKAFSDTVIIPKLEAVYSDLNH